LHEPEQTWTYQQILNQSWYPDFTLCYEAFDVLCVFRGRAMTGTKRTAENTSYAANNPMRTVERQLR